MRPTHPSALGPLWSWDIANLLGPAKWSYFYLYVILDIFSRYVVGRMIATAESAARAAKRIKETGAKQHIEKGRLTVHADPGFFDAIQAGSMTPVRPWDHKDPQ